MYKDHFEIIIGVRGMWVRDQYRKPSLKEKKKSQKHRTMPNIERTSAQKFERPSMLVVSVRVHVCEV